MKPSGWDLLDPNEIAPQSRPVDDAQPPPRRSGWDILAEQEAANDAVVRRAFEHAFPSETTVDRELSAMRFARETGLPADFVNRNYEELHRSWTSAQFDVAKWRKDNSVLDAMIRRDPDLAEIAMRDPSLAALQQLSASSQESSLVGDLWFKLNAGALKGYAMAFRGAGALLRIAGQAVADPALETFGLSYEMPNIGDPWADWVERQAQKGDARVSPMGHGAVEGSTPSGNLFQPSTWSLGDAPSLRGFAMHGTEIFGQMAPLLAMSWAAGSAAVAGRVGLAIGGAQSAGAAADDARQTIDTLASTPGKVEGTFAIADESAVYRAARARGMSHEEAVAHTRLQAEDWAAALAAPVGAVGGQLTAKLAHPATRFFVGRGRAVTALARTTASSLEEGTEEVLETIATRTGTSVGAGVEAPLLEGTFGDFFLGALGGAGPGFAGAIGEAAGEARVETLRRRREAMRQLGRELSSQAVVEKLHELAQGDTAKAAPDAIAEAIRVETAKSGEEVTSIFLDAEPVLRLFQENNVDPRPFLGEDAEARLAEAEATGGKIEIPVQGYVSRLGALPFADELAQHAATRPGHRTPAELVQENAAIEEAAQELVKRFEQENVPAESAEEADFLAKAEAQLEAAGVAKTNVQAQLAPLRAFARVMAERFKIPAKEIFKAYTLKITGSGRRVQATPQGRRTPAAKAAPAAPEQTEALLEVAPEVIAAQDETPAASRVLTDAFHDMDREARLGAFYRDTNTGLLNRRGFDALPVDPERPLVAHLSVEGTKFVNDTESHVAGDALYRAVGAVLGEVAPDAAKLGGDFAVRVKDQAELDALLQAVNGRPELRGLEVTGAIGETFEAAGQAHGELKAQLEAEGRRTPRGERPLGLAEGATFEAPTPGARPLPAGLEEAFDAMPEEQAFEAMFVEPASGLLTGQGFYSLPHKAARLSLDVDGLKYFNTRFGLEGGDLILQALGIVAADTGAASVDAAHVSGDEFRGQHDDAATLEEFARKLAENAEQIEIPLTDPQTGEEFILHGIPFSFGVGESDADADAALNQNKADRRAAGLRGEEAYAQRLVRRGDGDAEVGAEAAGVGTDSLQGPSDRPRTGRQRFAGPRRQGVVGNDTRVITPQRPQGERAHYAVIEAADLIPSHDPHGFTPHPAYPAGVQEREYHRQPEEKAKVARGAATLNPALLLTDTPTAVDGPPLVAAGRAIVLGGNGRSMMLLRAFGDEGARAKYREALLEKAEGFGLDRGKVEGMEAPVLVRVLDDVPADAPQADLVAAVRRTNEGLTQALSPRARAVAEAKTMSPETVASIGELLADAGDASLREVMRESPAQLVQILRRDGIITAQNQAAWLAGANLTEEARDRIEGMFLGRVVGSGDRLAKTAPSIAAKVERLAAPLLRVEGVNPAASAIPLVQQALDLLNDAKVRGLTLEELTGQQGLFAETSHDPDVMRLASLLGRSKPRELEARFRAWANEAATDPRQTTMFDTPATPEELRAKLLSDTVVFAQDGNALVLYQPDRPAQDAAPRLDPMADVPVVATDLSAFESLERDARGNPTKKAVTAWAKEHLRGSYRNVHTGWEIGVGGDGIKHAVREGGHVAHAALTALPDLLQNAVLASSEAHKGRSPRKTAMHQLYAPLEIDGVLHRVKLTVEEGQPGHRFYHLHAVAIENPASTRSRGQEAPRGNPTGKLGTPGTIKVGQLLEGVKGGPDATGEVRARSGATQLAPTFGRDELGAGLLDKLSPSPASSKFEHRRDGKARGFMERAGNDFTITIGKRGDLSTFLHETGHLMLEVFADLAARSDAPEQIREDFAKLLGWLGVEDRSQIQREHHEQFARGFEAYLFEGKAPSAALRRAFGRIKMWMKRIYSAIAALDVELSDDVRGVFDRLLATDAEIELARERSGSRRLLERPEYMDDAAWAEYQAAMDRAELEEEKQVALRALEDRKREAERWYREELAKELEAAEAEYDALPAVRAWRYLRFSELNGEKVEPAVRIDRDSAEAVLGKNHPQLKELRGILLKKSRKKRGEPAENLAAELGFASAREMFEAVWSQNLPARDKWTQNLAAQRMREKHGDLLADRESLAQQIHEVQHSERGYGDAILRELVSLAATSGSRTVPVEAIKRAARQIVARTPVGKLSPRRALLEERRAADRFQKALLARDWGAATKAKQQQLLNHFLYREIVAAEKARDAFTKTAGELSDNKRRARIGVANPELRDLIDGLLVQLGVRPVDPDLPAFAGIGALSGILADIGITPVYDQERVARILFEQAKGPDWRKLSVEDLAEVHAALLQAKKAGIVVSEFVVQGRRQFFRDFAGEVLQEATAIRDRGLSPKDEAFDAEAWARKLRRLGILSGYKNIELIFEQLGQTAHAMFRRFLDAQVDEKRLADEVTVDFMKAWDALPEEMQERRYEAVDSSMLPVAGRTRRDETPTTREWMWMLFLNWGNEGNRQRLLDGFGWTEEQVLGFLQANLTKEEADFLQGILAITERLRPHMEKVHERVNGIRPGRVPNAPFTLRLADGQSVHYAGGYFPIRMDTQARDPSSGMIAARQADAGVQDSRSSAAAAVAKGFTKSRARRFDGTLSLEWGTVPAHLSQVIHYIAFEEFVRDMNRLLAQDAFLEAVERRLGRPYIDRLREWTKAVAESQDASVSGFTNFMLGGLGKARSAFVFSALAYNVRSWGADILQVATPLITGEVSARSLSASLRHGTPLAYRRLRQEALALSPELQKRAANLRETLQHKMREVGRKGNTKRRREGWTKVFNPVTKAYEPVRRVEDFIIDHSFIIQEELDAYTSTIIWDAARNDYLAAAAKRSKTGEPTAEDEARAIQHADDVVRKHQPSATALEQSALLRDRKGIGSLLAMFGFFNQLGNIVLRLMGEADTPAGRARAYGKAFALLLATNVLGSFLVGDGPEEDEGWDEWATRKALTAPFIVVPFVGWAAEEAAGRVTTFAWHGKAKHRRFSLAVSPMFAAGERFINALGKAAASDEPEEKVGAVLEAYGSVRGLPVTQGKRTGGAAWKMYTGELEPRDPLEAGDLLLFGDSPYRGASPLSVGSDVISGER